jgi:hypothetical protein
MIATRLADERQNPPATPGRDLPPPSVREPPALDETPVREPPRRPERDGDPAKIARRKVTVIEAALFHGGRLH